MNEINESTEWEWRPGVGYGPLLFGTQRDAMPNGFALLPEDNGSDVVAGSDISYQYYELPDRSMLLAFDEHGLSTIHFFRSFRLAGREIIGLDVEMAKAYLSGLDWTQEQPLTPDDLIWVTYQDVGLKLLVEAGLVSSAILSRVPD